MKAGLSRLSGHLVYLVQPNKPNKPNRPDRPSVSLQPEPLVFVCAPESLPLPRPSADSRSSHATGQGQDIEIPHWG